MDLIGRFSLEGCDEERDAAGGGGDQGEDAGADQQMGRMTPFIPSGVVLETVEQAARKGEKVEEHGEHDGEAGGHRAAQSGPGEGHDDRGDHVPSIFDEVAAMMRICEVCVMKPGP
jgi:hypothetical protein